VSQLRRVARYVRHLPGLEQAEWVWSSVRKPYLWALDASGAGVEIKVGDRAVVRIPAEYAGGSWEGFEPESIAEFVGWVRCHPGGIVLDIGSSIGIYSAVALFADSNVDVVAFDADLASLAAARRLCRHAAGNRLRLIHGLLGATSTEPTSLASAVARTEAALALAQTDVRGDVGTTRYVCLGDPDTELIPHHRLDDIGANIADGREILIKCDVEGAELQVLAGGQALLRRLRPHLLMSVHPRALSDYGHCAEDVRAFLRERNYDVRCLAVDHEEHWWCTPAATGSAGQGSG
jgi:FkbM family methyltransferase